MEPWELAARRYKQIVPETILKRHEFPTKKLLAWIEGEVCTAVEEVIKRPRFQEYARWPIQNLSEGADSKEREFIDKLHNQTMSLASTLLKLLKISQIKTSLEAKYPSKQVAIEKKTRITQDGSETIDFKLEEFDEFSLISAQNRALAEGDLPLFVNASDYFSPLPEFVETEDGKKIQRGETIPSLNFRLHPVGDFVVQAMFARIDPIVEILRRVSSACQRINIQEIQSVGRIDDLIETLSHQLSELESTKHGLEQRLTMSRQVRLRNSCIILTQIYAAFHVHPELSWLDLPEEVVQRGAEMIRHRFTSWDNAQMADRIAAAVTDLGRLYRSDELTLSELDEAVAHKRLVLSIDTQEYFWDQTAPNRLVGKSWEVLQALSECAREGQVMTEKDVYGYNVGSKSRFPTAVGRCLKQLPESLSSLVESGNSDFSYKLNLRRHEIQIF